MPQAGVPMAWAVKPVANALGEQCQQGQVGAASAEAASGSGRGVTLCHNDGNNVGYSSAGMTMTTTRTQPSEPLTRDRVTDDLLRAAQEVLEKEGPGAMTVRAIASRAGISTMAVYSRFGGKAKILEALFRRGFELLREELEKVPRLVIERSGHHRARLSPIDGSPSTTRVCTGSCSSGPFPDSIRPSSRARKGCGRPSTSWSTGSEAFIKESMGGVGEPVLVSYLIWSAVHGELSLELTQSVRTPLAGWLVNGPGAAERVYGQVIETVLSGLADRRSGRRDPIGLRDVGPKPSHPAFVALIRVHIVGRRGKRMAKGEGSRRRAVRS